MNFNKMTVPQLREHAAANNLNIDGLELKQDIIDAIVTVTPAALPETLESVTEPPESVTETVTNEEVKQNSEEPPENTLPGEETKTGENQETEQSAEKTEQGDTPTVIKRVLFASRILMSGDDVDAVHAALIAKGLHVGQDNLKGIYGAKTAVAVRHFQVQNRLIVDGKVGKFTAQALGFAWEG